MQKKYFGKKLTPNGYTLVETAITVTIIAILAGIALPAFGTLLAGWQRDKAVKAFTSHLQLTRSIAIQQGRRAVMCISEDGITCTASTTKDWKNGWIVYLDTNANNAIDEGETPIQVEPEHDQISSMLTNNKMNYFAFNPNGVMSAGMGSIQVTPRAGKTQKVTVSRVGRLRLSLEK